MKVISFLIIFIFSTDVFSNEEIQANFFNPISSDQSLLGISGYDNNLANDQYINRLDREIELDHMDDRFESLIELQHQFNLGDDRDNGGDGKLSEDGRITLTDLLGDNQYELYNRKEILKFVPKLRSIVQKITSISPFAGQKFWNSLGEIKFIFIDGYLKRLPEDHAYYELAEQKVQLAIRRGNYVVVSLPLFMKTIEREYLLVHEILHGLVLDKSDSQLRHIKVRGMTNYINENITSLSRVSLQDKFEDYGIIFGPSELGGIKNKSISFDLVEDSIINLLNHRLPIESKCTNLELVTQDKTFDREFILYINPELKRCS